MPTYQKHLRSPLKRGIISLILVTGVVIIGTVVLHFLENMPYIDSFYFISMIVTAQGPAMAPKTAAGKIFISLLSFVSIGVIVAALGFIFGPFLGRLWHIGIENLEEDLHLKNEEKKNIG